MNNIYLPKPATIKDIRRETPDTVTFTLVFDNEEDRKNFTYKPGQIMEVSVLGAGEAPISITSTPSRTGFLELCIKEVGQVTRLIHKMKVGDQFGLRGPYGNGFQYNEYKGRDILYVTGGIGLVPLRSLINYMFDNRSDYGRISILYGARTPSDLCFTEEVEQWKNNPNTEIHVTTDRGAEGYTGRVGLVTTLLPLIKHTPETSTAFVCGPPIMIPIVINELLKLGYKENEVISTLENYMKCAVGKCGHCEIGGKYLCVEGPVFRYNEMKEL
jgi:sulfhydrogenase subunit gamma (sulfur reductase)